MRVPQSPHTLRKFVSTSSSSDSETETNSDSEKTKKLPPKQPQPFNKKKAWVHRNKCKLSPIVSPYFQAMKLVLIRFLSSHSCNYYAIFFA